MSGQPYAPADLSPMEGGPVAICRGGWVGPRAGEEKRILLLRLPETEPRLFIP
jgi:hypothetical protein